MKSTNLKILIVAENASTRMGGEAILPFHYFRFLAQRGVDVYLVTHERVKEELKETVPEYFKRIYFIPGLKLESVLWRLGTKLPQRVAEMTFYYSVYLLGIIRIKKLVKHLVSKFKIDVVHQPAPVSPRQPSYLYNIGTPVVIGPMNGGMSFPPAFSFMPTVSERYVILIGRFFSGVLNHLFPGKKNASILLVANKRTRAALPKCACQNILELVENGVDLSLWDKNKLIKDKVEFTFVGRLVDWKGVDYLLEAISMIGEKVDITLNVIGDGPELSRLEELAKELSITQKVNFWGFIKQTEVPKILNKSRALVLPSVFECGGAVVLEAMALEIPVIATKWGGPADYITDECGILVEPCSKDKFIEGLAEAIIVLASNEQLATEMGKNGRARVEKYFSWNAKIDRVQEIYESI